MKLSRRQRVALDAISDTFAPGIDGLPRATEIGVPDEFLETLERFARPNERTQLLRLLSLWDALGVRFSARPQDERENVLRAWRDSRVEQRRTAFKVFRKGTLSHYYGLPAEPRAALGYPGALTHDAAHPPVVGDVPAGDLDLECDVCVVGSGAGGGTAAGVLSTAGLDVVVLEAGGPPGFHGEELDALRSLYLDGATTATSDQSVDVLAGSCLGGGTWVN